MNMIDITIPFDEEKLKALEFTLKRKTPLHSSDWNGRS